MSLFAGKPFLLGGFIICCKDRLLLKLHVLEVRYTVVGSLTIHAISSCERDDLADSEISTACAVRTKDSLTKQHSLSLGKELDTLVALCKLDTLVALCSTGLVDDFLDLCKADRFESSLLLVILALALIVDTGVVQHVAVVNVEAVNVGIRIAVVRTPAGTEHEVDGVGDAVRLIVEC